MLYDPEFARALAQARIARLIAEADAARAARTLESPEDSHAGWIRGFVVDARTRVADSMRRFVPGRLRSRRRTAVQVPRPRLGNESPQ